MTDNNTFQAFLIAMAAIIATATVGYGGYLGWQTTMLWHKIGELDGRRSECPR